KNNCENPSQALINLSLAGYIFLISHCASSGSGGTEGAILRSIESSDGSSSLSHSRISRRCSSLKPISIRAYSFGMTRSEERRVGKERRSGRPPCHRIKDGTA